MEEQTLTIPYLLNQSIKDNGEGKSLGYAGEEALTYSELKESIDKVKDILAGYNVNKGDKVALLSSNMPNWGVSYFAITCMGAVVVPILPDFTNEEIANVLQHSGAVAIFISNSLVSKIADFKNESLRLVITIDDFSILSAEDSISEKKVSDAGKSYDVNEEDIAAIIYTSGTTGKSKGVVLTHKNLCFTAIGSRKIQYVVPGDVFLSVLPLSHTYEQTLGLLLSTFNGATTYYLRKAATPSVLIPALKDIRPTVMLTVPLIMEKIYFSKILPTFQKNKILSTLYSISPIRKILNRAAGKKLYETFGGRLKFFGIGGAKVNPYCREVSY